MIQISQVRLDQAPIVQKVDNGIRSINLYPLDSAISFSNIYPLDSAIQRLNNSGQTYKLLVRHEVSNWGNGEKRKLCSIMQYKWVMWQYAVYSPIVTKKQQISKGFVPWLDGFWHFNKVSILFYILFYTKSLPEITFKFLYSTVPKFPADRDLALENFSKCPFT